MSLITIHYRRMTTFIYLLVFLLAFNLVFNLYYQWYGISIIVRVYLFVFSFYLIYNYSTIDIERLKELYRKRFGKKGGIFILFEMGIVPLLIVYGITVLFTFIDYLRLPAWPWNPLLGLLNGRYSNLVIYSLFLFIILKTKYRPGIKIVLFFSLSVLYFFADKHLSEIFISGIGVLVVKFVKLLVIFFFLFFGFLGESKKKWSLFYAAIVSSLVIALIIGGYGMVFRHSRPSSYQHIVSGLALMKFGFDYPVDDLKHTIIEKGEKSYVRDFIDISLSLKRDVQFTSSQWEHLLCSGTIEQANYIAGVMISKPVELSFERLIGYAKKQTAKTTGRIESASNFISLVAKNGNGKIEVLKKAMNGANENFILFALAVIGEMKDNDEVPMLLDYLTGVNFTLSDASYEALRKITGKDPAAEKGVQRNDPQSILVFHEQYRKNRKAP